MTTGEHASRRGPVAARATEQGESAAGRQLRSARRGLQLALAAAWLLDAALQYQPYMFTKRFVTHTLAPAAQGNPAAIADPMRWVFHAMVGHVAAFNAVFATVQLAIAAGLMWRRSVKIALAVSVAWAIGVWWFGEGLGGVLSGASPVMGAPGAVILYALVALLVWPTDRTGDHGSVSEGGALGVVGARLAWPILWGALAYLFLVPANRAPGALHDALAASAGGEPGWLAGIDQHLAAIVASNDTAASITLAVACDVIAISIFVPRLRRAGIIGAAAVGGFLWVTEAFGAIFTGQGTDPNSGLLLVLVAATFWPLSRPTEKTVVALPRATALNHRIGLLVAVALLVTGGGAGLETRRDAPARQATGVSMSAGMVMVPYSPVAAATRAAGPSQSARMVCSSEIRRDVATALALHAEPAPSATWADGLYTCTYHLPSGRLVLAVKQLKSGPSAHAYFDHVRQHLAPTQQIVGLASLGLASFETPTGTVMFLKDDKTLEVDATSFSSRVGPALVSPTDFAYQIATDILGCWTGK